MLVLPIVLLCPPPRPGDPAQLNCASATQHPVPRPRWLPRSAAKAWDTHLTPFATPTIGAAGEAGSASAIWSAGMWDGAGCCSWRVGFSDVSEKMQKEIEPRRCKAHASKQIQPCAVFGRLACFTGVMM